ncbi:hypothetical protein KC338_g147 [Hortaea werneckii]|nr:hypothetical protein KC338_g147 [Hortaea werneckii]
MRLVGFTLLGPSAALISQMSNGYAVLSKRSATMTVWRCLPEGPHNYLTVVICHMNHSGLRLNIMLIIAFLPRFEKHQISHVLKRMLVSVGDGQINVPDSRDAG